jgi:hypothetical protein
VKLKNFSERVPLTDEEAGELPQVQPFIFAVFIMVRVRAAVVKRVVETEAVDEEGDSGHKKPAPTGWVGATHCCQWMGRSRGLL